MDNWDAVVTDDASWEEDAVSAVVDMLRGVLEPTSTFSHHFWLEYSA